MFAGYGGASHGLRKAGVPFECVGYSEIDKYAIKCYEQNFPGIKNYGDARKINPKEIPDFDLLTGGFPCQAFSIAGKFLGEKDERGTLFQEIVRIAEVKKPRYMILENVKGLVTKTHKSTLRRIVYELRRIGYTVAYKVLNSKDYGIPQNRERIWFVCIREDLEFDFMWPESEKLKIFLKDILEENADKKYFLTKTAVEWLKKYNEENKRKKRGFFWEPRDISKTATTISARVQFGATDNSVACKNGCPFNVQSLGNVNPSGKGMNGNVYDTSWISPTLTTNKGEGLKIYENYSIRKLTPKECFRLMGFLNDEINLEGLSDTQKYKLAGNGWDINLVSKIFKNLLSGSNFSVVSTQPNGANPEQFNLQVLNSTSQEISNN